MTVFLEISNNQPGWENRNSNMLPSNDFKLSLVVLPVGTKTSNGLQILVYTLTDAQVRSLSMLRVVNTFIGKYYKHLDTFYLLNWLPVIFKIFRFSPHKNTLSPKKKKKDFSS